MTALQVPEVGDIAYLDFDPQAGHEQSRRRPALVLTPSGYNAKAGLAIVAPITSKVKGYPFEVSLGKGLPIQGVALADQLTSFDWRARRFEFVCKASRSALQHTRQLIGELLGV